MESAIKSRINVAIDNWKDVMEYLELENFPLSF